MIHIKSLEEIKIMAQGCKILADIMKQSLKQVKAGVATQDIDRFAESLVLKYGAKCSFKGYGGFPACSCISINEEIVHGIPSARKLKQGDILTLDMGIFYKGYHSDMAITVPVGEIDFEVQRLIRAAKKSLKRGIKVSRVGNTFGDISNTIQRYAESQNLNVARDLCGHGIGKNLHEDPEILNYGKRGRGAQIQEGMVFCLEPMVVLGSGEIKLAENGQTYKTKDGSWAAHFEHTIAITKNGPKILTEMESADLEGEN